MSPMSLNFNQFPFLLAVVAVLEYLKDGSKHDDSQMSDRCSLGFLLNTARCPFLTTHHGYDCFEIIEIFDIFLIK